jgi:hypothetical protein
VKKSKLAFIAGSAFADGRTIILTWNGEPRLRRELVILGIVSAFKPDANGRFDASLSRTASSARPQQRAVCDPPEFEIVPKLRAVLLVQASDDYLDDDGLRRLVLYSAIIAPIKIMLVDGLCSRQPIRSNRKFDRLEYGRFPGIVVAEENGRSLKIDVGELYAAKIFYMNTSDPHHYPIDISVFIS